MSPALLQETPRSEAQGAANDLPRRPAVQDAVRIETSPLDAHPAASGVSVRTACEAASCTASFRAEAAEVLLPEAQRRWAARPLVERLQCFRAARHWIAAHPEVFTKAISPALARSEADTLVTELLPLLDAMRFLERRAAKILAPRRLGVAGRPAWLLGVDGVIFREPLGHVLVIGPANFPLFLPGVQAIQALVAGNAVTWKPGTGGQPVALLLHHVLRQAGLPRGVLHVTDESVEAAQHALARHPDKVVFTGSFAAGQKVLRSLAETATPAAMELSGADAVVVLPTADLSLVAKAVAFGLRLNGAEVCMSPRRLVATRDVLHTLRPLLVAELANLPAVHLKPSVAHEVEKLLADAQQQGASLLTSQTPEDAFAPTLVDHATSAMAITHTDVFAPVLSLMEAPSVLHLAEQVNSNPYGLTAAIFGSPQECRSLAAQLRVGTVLINDLIAPTADPRIPFGGRGRSGYGLTRGAEGLLEVTAAKTVLTRTKGVSHHYVPLGQADVSLFAGLVGTLHGGSWKQRWQALHRLFQAVRSRGKLTSLKP